MKRNFRTLIVAASFATLAGAALFAHEAEIVSGGDQALAPADYWKIRSPQPGDQAPPLALAQIYDRPAGMPDASSFSLNALRGRVVVLEFSASWCAPCIGLIPHMNELVAEFQDKPVTFLTIDNESDADIARFRANHPMKSLVARDTNNTTHRNYWVSALPAVAIVTPEGKIATITHPTRLTKEVILDVLAGRPVTLPPMPASGVQAVSSGATNPTQDNAAGASPAKGATATLSEVDGVPNMRTETNKITGEMRLTGSPRDLILFAYDALPYQIDYRAPMPAGRSYQAYIKPIDGRPETAKKMLRQLLETNLGVTVAVEQRPIKAKLLRRVPDAPALRESTDPTSRTSYQAGVFASRNSSIATVVNFLSKTLSEAVIDETGLTQKYDIEFTWDPKGGSAALIDAIKKLGFVLVDGESKINFLTVTAGGH